MDIIQRLPFPDEVCRKIFLFTCKTPHTGLGVEVLKNKLNMDHLNLPEKDEDVTCIDKDAILNPTSLDAIDIYSYTCFKNLTSIRLYGTDVFGDIKHLMTLTNLTELFLNKTGVTGDIIRIGSLHNLIMIKLGGTSVFGNREVFNNYRKSKGLKVCLSIDI